MSSEDFLIPGKLYTVCPRHKGIGFYDQIRKNHMSRFAYVASNGDILMFVRLEKCAYIMRGGVQSVIQHRYDGYWFLNGDGVLGCFLYSENEKWPMKKFFERAEAKEDHE